MLVVLQEMVNEMDRILQATERINEKLESELQDTVRILSAAKRGVIQDAPSEIVDTVATGRLVEAEAGK
jgi:hypothetical protein